jgi:hypothetical protein
MYSIELAALNVLADHLHAYALWMFLKLLPIFHSHENWPPIVVTNYGYAHLYCYCCVNLFHNKNECVY